MDEKGIMENKQKMVKEKDEKGMKLFLKGGCDYCVGPWTGKMMQLLWLTLFLFIHIIYSIHIYGIQIFGTIYWR